MIRTASETATPGHEGGSDSVLSCGLTDKEFDKPGINRERANCSELKDFLGDSSPSLTYIYNDGINSEMYPESFTPYQSDNHRNHAESASLTLSSYLSASTGPSVADMIQKRNMLWSF